MGRCWKQTAPPIRLGRRLILPPRAPFDEAVSCEAAVLCVPETLLRIIFVQHFEWSKALDSAGVIPCVHVAAKSEKCTARSTDSWFLCICELAAGLRSYFQESVVETTSRLAPMHSHTPGSICSFNWSILVGFPIMLRLPAIFGHLFQFSKMYKTKYTLFVDQR